MRRFSLLVVAVLSFALSALVQPAQAGESYIKTLKVNGWVEAGALASTAKDTMFVTDEADTARSVMIDLSDLDWDGILSQPGPATKIVAASQTNQPDTLSAIPIAEVSFVVTKANNGVADTLYWNIERAAGVPGGSCVTCKPDTIFSHNPVKPSLGYGSTGSNFSTVSGPTNTANQFNQNVYRGYIYASRADSKNNGMLLRKFRLVTAGDVGGSSPKLSGVMCFITYLAKR